MADFNTNTAATSPEPLPQVTGSEPASDESATEIAALLDGDAEQESDGEPEFDDKPAVGSGNDGDDASDEGASEESDDTETDPESEAELYEVKVNGRTEKVTRQELLKGYSRERDYTAKTQALAAERQQVEAMKAQAQAALQNALQNVAQDPIIAEGQKTDWKRLAVEDPAGFVAKSYQYNARLQELQQLHAQHAAQQSAALQKTGETEAAKLLERIPEWKEPARAQAGIKLLTEYLTDAGFTAQELRGFTDSRAYQVAYDAARYRKLMAAKGSVKQQQVVQAPVATRTVKPGTSSSKPTNSAKIKALDTRAARSGSMDDAVEAIMARL